MSTGAPSAITTPQGRSALVADLRRLLKQVAAALTARSDDPSLPWAQGLRAAHDSARERGRTGLTWSQWRTDEVEQAAVAWVLGSVFVRFCEDNGLIDGSWIAGAGDRARFAADAEAEFYRRDPSRNARDWLRAGFAALADLPASSGVLDRAHSPAWTAPLGADTAAGILAFWREQHTDGSLRRSLVSPDLDTRFLGDVYQDLSESAKKKYALLQTPVFVEEFILDRTLEPALAEHGLEGLRLIDPTCGSGHFLLGAFDRLLAAWAQDAPGLDPRERVQRALDHIHGVDINPFAVAIARFRLTVAALRASGLTRLADAPGFHYHLAVGDSLLAAAPRQHVLLDAAGNEAEEGLLDHQYPAEDIHEHPGILETGRYHVVVGNPPYITVKDKALNEAYRGAYPMCAGKYALSVPFLELFFRLAVRGAAGTPAGFVGQITANSFMKREFGRKLIEGLLSGHDIANPVDLTAVIDTSGAYIPGHGTPTVILIGRRRTPRSDAVRAVLGVRGEPGQPSDPVRGLVWTQIVDHLDEPGFDGEFVSVTDLPREALARHPWSLSGGGAGELQNSLDGDRGTSLSARIDGKIGPASFPGADDVFFASFPALRTRAVPLALIRQVITGDVVRDWDVRIGDFAVVPYDSDGHLVDLDLQTWGRRQWPFRTVLSAVIGFGGITRMQAGEPWWAWYRWVADRYRTPLSIAFAFVATHNHFVLDRGGKVFKQSAPVIKLPEGASLEEHLGLLGVLNSSAACFWLKQVSHNKGEGGGARVEAGFAARGEPWRDTYEFTGTKLQEFPLPEPLPVGYGRRLDDLAQALAGVLPAAVLAGGGVPSRAGLDAARAEYGRIRAEMVFWQEELDWHVYGLYGLVDADVTYGGGFDADITSGVGFGGGDAPGLRPGQQAFALALARRVAAGQETTSWFTHHNHKFTPVTQIPEQWPAGYRKVVQRRLDLIASDKTIRLLERPEFKRRWAARSWDDLERDALVAFCADRLESPGLWSDAQGPVIHSVNGLAQRLRGDEPLMAALRLLAGTEDVDVAAAVGPLMADEAVPFLAAHRYTDDGLVKRREWEQVWDLQRREDAGEQVDIPVPPKYGQKDFRKTAYWRARGKLDVPKERFISYPGAGRGADTSAVVGWAGWDHAEQARALARLLLQRQSEDGWGRDELLPLLAGLAELEPWLHQWYSAVDPAFGQSPARAITDLLDGQLAQYGLTRQDLSAWRPPTPVRGRKRKG